jgi:CBS-domain-containing membrane protein
MINKQYAVLASVTLDPGTPCYTPSGWVPLAYIDDPAISVMTDFKELVPVTIEPHFRVDAALAKMKVAGVRLLLVPDVEDNITGIITAADILGDRPLRRARELEMSHHELHVDMIMTPLDRVLAVDMATVRDARVGHIISMLRKHERQHMLVVEIDRMTRQHMIRGMFSTSQISKLVGQDITDPEYAAHTLAEVYHELG